MIIIHLSYHQLIAIAQIKYMKYKFLLFFGFVIIMQVFKACDQLRVKSYVINHNCGSDQFKTFTPPKGTHRCEIKLMNNCKCEGLFEVLREEVVVSGVDMRQDKGLQVFQNDWYDEEIGIRINSSNIDDKNRTCNYKLIFYY